MLLLYIAFIKVLYIILDEFHKLIYLDSEMANLQDDMYQKKAELGIQADVEDYMCQRKADESKLLLTEHAYFTRPPLELPMHATIATPGMSTTGGIPSTSSPVKDYPPFRFQPVESPVKSAHDRIPQMERVSDDDTILSSESSYRRDAVGSDDSDTEHTLWLRQKPAK